MVFLENSKTHFKIFFWIIPYPQNWLSHESCLKRKQNRYPALAEKAHSLDTHGGIPSSFWHSATETGSCAVSSQSGTPGLLPSPCWSPRLGVPCSGKYGYRPQVHPPFQAAIMFWPASYSHSTVHESLMFLDGSC